MVKVKRTRVRTSRLALTVTPHAYPAAGGPLPPAARANGSALLARLRAEDEAREATGRAKNGLEAFILAQRERFESAGEDGDSSLAQVTSPEQRSAFLEALTLAEDWLYGDGAESNAASFDSRLAELRQPADAAQRRAAELAQRPAAVARARAFLSDTREAVGEWVDTRPQVNESEKEGLLALVAGCEAWLKEAEAAQAGKSLVEEPAFASADVGEQLKPVEALLAKLKRKPAPKPPKVVNFTLLNESAAAEEVRNETVGAEEAGADETVHSELRK
jgi:hypoxia up-regulated 1